ncbi:MAG: pyridoxal phosphate-dependent aminotransferase [Proteobacteria bacterium]|nr:pyridoxal phosphate-dependent aminotransferase [Pseudomonadota bacterium]
MSFLSRRLDGVKPSATLAINSRALELKAQGYDVINLGVGEPDFDTPQNIKHAAIKAIEAGATKYTTINGTKELRKAISMKFHRDNGLDYTVDEVIAGTGAKQLLFNGLMATVDHGDEVIIPAPYWGSYEEMVIFAGGKPVIVEGHPDNNFKITAAQLEAAITPRTKWFMLNSPSNPSGAVYSAAELKSLSEVLLRHPHVYIMSDDIYEHIIFDGIKFTNIVQVEPALFSRTLVINGVSKSYSMTGWRLGYAAGPLALIKAMITVQSHSTSCASSISQAAATEALNGPQTFLESQSKSFAKRRDLIVRLLNEIPGIHCAKPQGAFYVLPDFRGIVGMHAKDHTIKSCEDVAAYLLEEAQIAVVPGAAFGIPGFLRISYPVSEQVIESACNRIARSLSKLKK